MFDVDASVESMKIPRSWIFGILGASLVMVGFCGWKARSQGKTVAKAAAQEVVAVTDLGQAQALGQIAQDRAPELQAARNQVLSLKAQLAEALKSRQPGQNAPAAPDAVVIKDQGQVILAQDHKADLLEAQLGTVTAENQANHAAALNFQAETVTLKKEITPQLTRALGVIWNPADQTYGVCFDQDVWRLRLGVDVFQQRLPVLAGGNVKWTAALRAQFRF